MKFFSFTIILSVFTICLHAQEIDKTKKALVLIDIQNFYFPGGKLALKEPEKASKNASLILDRFRQEGLLVIHVRHNFELGGEIHKNVEPKEGEQVFSKDEVNAFNGTQLRQYLNQNEIEQLVLAGMQTHMCLEGTTRAAYDLGFDCIVIEDACATKDLKYKERIISAEDVHNVTLKTLESYAVILNTEEFLLIE